MVEESTRWSSTYHIEDFRVNEGFYDVKDLIEERHHVHHVYRFQLRRQPVLQVVEKLSHRAHVDAGQMHQPDVLHVEQEDDARPRSLRVQAGVDRHEVRLDRFVKVIVGGAGVFQPMKHHRIPARGGWKWEVVSASEMVQYGI